MKLSTLKTLIFANFDLRVPIHLNPENTFMAVFIDLWPFLFTTISTKLSCLNEVNLLQILRPGRKMLGPKVVELTPPNIWLAMLFEPIFLSTSKVKPFFKFSLISISSAIFGPIFKIFYFYLKRTLNDG